MKTIEEKAQQRAFDIASSLGLNIVELIVALHDLYIEATTEALSGQWRSVEDELPKDHQNILIYYRYKDGWKELDTKYSFLQVTYNTKNGFALFEKNMNKWDCKVLFWLPLPEPPKD